MKEQKEISMASTTLHHPTVTEKTDSQWRSMCKLGGIAALLQLVCVLTSTVIAILVGTEPANAEEYFRSCSKTGLRVYYGWISRP